MLPPKARTLNNLVAGEFPCFSSSSLRSLLPPDGCAIVMIGSKEYDQSDFGNDHLVMSMCRVISCVVGRGCFLQPVRSLGQTLLAFALLHFVL